MLTEYTTPGASVEVRDDESIYSLLTERIKRTGEDTVIAERKTAPGQWTKGRPANSTRTCSPRPKA